MIIAIHHSGLEKFYRTGNTAGIMAAYAKQLRFVLLALDSAYVEQDLSLPNMRLTQQGEIYELYGEFGAMQFRFAWGNVEILDYIAGLSTYLEE